MPACVVYGVARVPRSGPVWLFARFGVDHNWDQLPILYLPIKTATRPKGTGPSLIITSRPLVANRLYVKRVSNQLQLVLITNYLHE